MYMSVVSTVSWLAAHSAALKAVLKAGRLVAWRAVWMVEMMVV